MSEENTSRASPEVSELDFQETEATMEIPERPRIEVTTPEIFAAPFPYSNSTTPTKANEALQEPNKTEEAVLNELPKLKIPPHLYQFTNDSKTKIFVFDDSSKTKGREYLRFTPSRWTCVRCSTGEKKLKLIARFQDGAFYVPPEHECQSVPFKKKNLPATPQSSVIVSPPRSTQRTPAKATRESSESPVLSPPMPQKRRTISSSDDSSDSDSSDSDDESNSRATTPRASHRTRAANTKNFPTPKATPRSRQNSPYIPAREVSNQDFQLGNSLTTEGNRIFVREPENRDLGREYFFRKKWFCLHCFYQSDHSIYALFDPENQKVFAPTASEHRCKPKPYISWLKNQERYGNSTPGMKKHEKRPSKNSSTTPRAKIKTPKPTVDVDTVMEVEDADLTVDYLTAPSPPNVSVDRVSSVVDSHHLERSHSTTPRVANLKRAGSSINDKESPNKRVKTGSSGSSSQSKSIEDVGENLSAFNDANANQGSSSASNTRHQNGLSNQAQAAHQQRSPIAQPAQPRLVLPPSAQAPRQKIIFKNPLVQNEPEFNGNDSDTTTSSIASHLILPPKIEILRPSEYTIMQWAAKLGVTVTSPTKAYRFWARHDSKVALSTTDLRGVYCLRDNSIPEESGYRCLSLYLTGTEDHYLSIKRAIKEKFYDNFNTMGFRLGVDFGALNLRSDLIKTSIFQESLNNVLCEFTAQLLGVRIGVFEDGILQKYGDWTEERSAADISTFLMELRNDRYRVVLSIVNLEEE